MKNAPKNSEHFIYKFGIIFGERVWESNPPRTLLTPNTGFEDQGAHQLPNRAHSSFIV